MLSSRMLSIELMYKHVIFTRLYSRMQATFVSFDTRMRTGRVNHS